MGEDGRARRWVGRGAIALVVVLLLGTAAGGWRFADLLTEPPPAVWPFEPDNTVLAVAGDTLTLTDDGRAAVDGPWGLEFADGRHVVLREQLGRSDGGIRWRFDDVLGGQPTAGDDVRVAEYVFTGTPAAVDLPFEDVEVAGPLGTQLLPAWWVPTAGDDVGTVVFVHGRGANRQEALRFLPTLTDAGWNVLVQTYRGDAGAPPWPDGRVRFGTTEWADVAAAVSWVDERRPEQPIVLFGTSMGGALIGQFLDNSQQAQPDGQFDVVDGVILDSPVLSLDALLDLQAGLNGVPEWAEPALLPAVKLIADLRVEGFDSDALEQVADDATWSDPLLLVHGDADDFVPAEPSQELAELLGDRVTFLRVPEAGHVRTWNHAPDAYADALRSFLSEVAG